MQQHSEGVVGILIIMGFVGNLVLFAAVNEFSKWSRIDKVTTRDHC